LEAVVWKPAISWKIERILVLEPIRFVAFRRNEVRTKATAPAQALVREGGPVHPYFAEDDRAQRNTLALRDVDYVIEAHLTLTERAGPSDNVTKFVDIFERRVEKGQCFHHPYLGCRELAAEIHPATGHPDPIADSRDLGLMLWDLEYGPTRNRPLFFAARLDCGVLEIPVEPLAPAPAGGAA